MDNNANQKVSCIASYSYEASEPDELSLRAGDVVKDVERLPGGWWKGELRGRRGMFPDNFVTVIEQGNASRTGGVQGRCRAVFSYQPANPDELPLCVGDVIEVLGEVEEGWWQGRRQGRVGVFPSNFVVMQEPLAPTPPSEPAPALPPKPVKEQCRVLFPYSAVNEDELTLSEGEIVTIVSKDAPDRGWWRGELNGKVGLFPDNFVQLLPPVTQEIEEKKPERPPVKTTNSLYPVLNKYSEKTSSIKELTTSKTSLHKENTLSKESSAQSTITHTNKSESEKIIHSETVTDGVTDGQVKKPPVPSKKSPTPGGLFSGLKSKMLSTDKEKSTVTVSNTTTVVSNGGDVDRADGVAASRSQPATNTNTLDHVQRNSILSDPRAGRVKAPRRRPPSQVFRDDTPPATELSNGHEAPVDKLSQEKPPSDKTAADKAEEIKPKAREWEKHRAPWMAELKLNQAKKTSLISEVGKSRSVSSSSESGVASKAGGGSTDRILECGLEEKKSTHSMEMSKSTSSISSRISVIEGFEETTKVRHSLESRKESSPVPPREDAVSPKPAPAHSPTAAGRTFSTMLEDVKKPPAPAPPSASVRTSTELNHVKLDRGAIEAIKLNASTDKVEERPADKQTVTSDRSSLERRLHSGRSENGSDALVAQLNNRISNLEKLLEVQNAKFNAAIEELNTRLALEVGKRQALQGEVDKLAHCVTQV